MAKTNTSSSPARTATTAIPSAEDYCATLDQATAQSRALLAARSPTVRIPANIRTSMRSLQNLSAWWAKPANRAILSVLGEGTAPMTKAAKA
jgi:hypothetical protein